MKLYKCNLTIYVLAESKQEAQEVAVNNCEDEHWDNWKVEHITERVSGMWGDCLPYINEPNEYDDLNCNQFLERKQDE
jgi:hypothetical protein